MVSLGIKSHAVLYYNIEIAAGADKAPWENGGFPYPVGSAPTLTSINHKSFSQGKPTHVLFRARLYSNARKSQPKDINIGHDPTSVSFTN